MGGACGLLLMCGALDGTASLWRAADHRWKNFKLVAHWLCHLQAVRCVELSSNLGMALSSSDDGFVHVYRLRRPLQPLRTFAFVDRLPVTEARFASAAPVTIVASSSGSKTAGLKICVWALHGFLLASIDLEACAALGGLRVLQEGDARESLLVSTGNGSVELRSLPYLHPIWSRACQWSARPTALDSAARKGIVWLGHEDGSFEAVFARS